MDKNIQGLVQNWEKRNINGFYFSGKEEACRKIFELIPVSASIGISGSQTLDNLGIIQKFECRGNSVFNPYKQGLSRQESFQIRNNGAQADYYLTSANAVSGNGELVFFSAYGHRISGIANAKNVIVICGLNKITADIEGALKRARQYSTPLNCKRLEWNTPCFKDGLCAEDVCFFPEYKRMCCQVLIIEAEVIPGRLKVILIGEDLGY
jgi:hypothetical protein